MIKTGDTVRYLNAVGGGIVRRIEGKVAYVDEDGFETPVLVNELVVVLPAGHQKKEGGPNLMFDQAAFDAAKTRHTSQSATTSQLHNSTTSQLHNSTPPSLQSPSPAGRAGEGLSETRYGDALNIALAFEPTAIRTLDKSDFNAVLVNDSNYWLLYSFLRRGSDDRGWHEVSSGELAPNELMDLTVVKREELNDYERISLQYVAVKKGKEFEMKPPTGISRRLDLTKFFKLHCFRPGIYFESPVMEIQLVKDDKPQADMERRIVETLEKNIPAQRKETKPSRGKELSPYKLLPLVEVDLHIDELVDTTAGMENKDMLMLQLDTVRKTMQEHSRRKGQKIVFIHGKGDGVLRKAVRDLLKKEYAKCELQDASFQEYGFGATLVTIR